MSCKSLPSLTLGSFGTCKASPLHAPHAKSVDKVGCADSQAILVTAAPAADFRAAAAAASRAAADTSGL